MAFQRFHRFYSKQQRVVNRRRGLVYWRPEGAVKENFGDELSPWIVGRMLERRGFSLRGLRKRLLAVGSVLEWAQDGDVVWGSGKNGRTNRDRHHFRQLDVRLVRGPLTREFLLGVGVECPERYGDPALLLPRFVSLGSVPRRGHLIIPNYNDLALFGPESETLIYPGHPVRTILGRILSSRLVIASSLHGIVVAEAFGIRAQLCLLAGHREQMFKYRDYYASTGRTEFRVATSVEEALDLGGEAPGEIDTGVIEDSFPYDLCAGESGILGRWMNRLRGQTIG